jgi:hypothetical protein
MTSKFGFSSLNSNLNRNNNNSFNTLQSLSNNQIKAVRVKNIILDDSNSKWKTYGEWNGLGTIEFLDVKKPKSLNSNGIDGIAQPLFSYLKNYPLINEIVYIIELPSSNIGEKVTATKFYYITAINLWNSQHHNASPFISDALPENQQRDYLQTEGGSVRRSIDQSTEITLGEYFKEKLNIHPLLPFEGDIIHEGRWGNSIRFGSTVKEKSNTWSSSGTSGDPITIIRNGQDPNSSDEGWIPVKEDINKDLSSIYLTSKQKIPFSIANENFYAYDSPPLLPSLFTSPQIILNSDRVILNAKTDSVLISGEKSVGLSSNNSINIESLNEINISSKLVRLGGKSASQPVLKGDETVSYLKVIINELQNISEALKTIQDWPSGTPVPNSTLLTVAGNALKVFENVYNEIDNVKSKTVKTL